MVPAPSTRHQIMEQMTRKLSDVVETGDQSVPNSPECAGRAGFSRDCGFKMAIASQLSGRF